jgi:hypothetical protein
VNAALEAVGRLAFFIGIGRGGEGSHWISWKNSVRFWPTDWHFLSLILARFAQKLQNDGDRCGGNG